VAERLELDDADLVQGAYVLVDEDGEPIDLEALQAQAKPPEDVDAERGVGHVRRGARLDVENARSRLGAAGDAGF
jgi:hypothetical protein